MKHFFINMLSEKDIAEQVAKVGQSAQYGEKSKPFTFTEGHKREYAINRFFDNSYVFQKDTRPFFTYSDIPSKNASVKSPNATMFVDGKRINDNTPVEEAIEYYINNCVSTIYYIVLKPKKWIDTPENKYAVIELTKKEMKRLLMEYASTDRDSRAHVKNCLRLKRTDDVIAKWYRMNRSNLTD